MTVKRLAILAFLLWPAIALAQNKEDDENKVTNDRPDRPMQMPPASSEVKESFDDYERFRRRNAWERALKALYTIAEAQAQRFVDGENGFIISVGRKRREVLGQLPPEGQVAYRLFYDDEAKKLLDQADGASELATLERIYSAYFLTTVGDNAADRLGDLYFEMGRFDRAADCWLAILRERPDTDLSPALLSVKAALALSRAGRRSELATVRREIAERYAGETISIGGQRATAADQLRRYLAEDEASAGSMAKDAVPTAAVDDAELEATLDRAIPAVWRMRFADSVEAGMAPPELTQWETNPLSAAIPAVAISGTTLYANFLGYVFAMNLENGKMIWRSAGFHNLETPAQGPARMVDPTRFAIVASKNYVWTLGRDLADPNQMALFRLVCRRTDGGDVVWQSSDFPDYSQLDLVGIPILVGESIFVVGKPQTGFQQGVAPMYVFAIRSRDGKMLWKTEIGTTRQNQQRYFFYAMSDTSPQPRLFHQAGTLYVDTHNGILTRLDAASGELDWGYGYQTEAVQAMNWFFYRMPMNEPASGPSDLLRLGDAMYGKGAKSERIYALDVDRMKVLWDRPIAQSARILGGDDQAIFLGGPEISALDIRTKKLLWATRLPGGSAEAKLLVRPGGLWQLTPRGVFEMDPRSGRVRRIFRGEDMGVVGGDLYLTGRLLLAVSNRAISAYPISATPAGRSDGVDKVSATPKARATDD
jgi:outer membrane protein assembly factor BamB